MFFVEHSQDDLFQHGNYLLRKLFIVFEDSPFDHKIEDSHKVFIDRFTDSPSHSKPLFDLEFLRFRSI